MNSNFVSLRDKKAFDEFVSRSKDQPVVIFKHSTTCSISAAAYQEMKKFGGEIGLVEVQKSRELSREIESRLGVTHESPQILILRNGRVVWNASHWKVRADEVAKAVRQSEGQ